MSGDGTCQPYALYVAVILSGPLQICIHLHYNPCCLAAEGRGGGRGRYLDYPRGELTRNRDSNSFIDFVVSYVMPYKYL